MLHYIFTGFLYWLAGSFIAFIFVQAAYKMQDHTRETEHPVGQTCVMTFGWPLAMVGSLLVGALYIVSTIGSNLSNYIAALAVDEGVRKLDA